MKKVHDKTVEDDLRPECDLASLGPGVRGKYAERLKGTTLVALRSEVAQAFPTSDAVNDALQTVMRARAATRRSRRPDKRVSGTTERRSARSRKAG